MTRSTTSLVLLALALVLSGCVGAGLQTAVVPKSATSALTTAANGTLPLGMHVVPMDVQVHDPGFILFDSIDCPRPVGVCDFHGSGVAYFSGSMVGRYNYRVWGHSEPNGTVLLDDDGWYSGSINGCGTGAATFHYSGYTQLVTLFDPAIQRWRVPSVEAIIPGSASEGLHGATGAVVGEFLFRDWATKENDAPHLLGNVTCGDAN